jgi:hypothetical protein
METVELLLKFITAETEAEVEKIIEDDRLCSNPENWLPYGNKENNAGTVQGQQSEAVAALVEKIINAMDAVLILKCWEDGVEPTSGAAPKSIQDAVRKFFGIREGLLVNASRQDRIKLSELVQLVASGKKTSPCLTIIDQGEGQPPHLFASTFLSLYESNKNRIQFVQGKFNMGGTGALPFCGREHFQLLISRRAPTLAKSPDDKLWGFTLVRRFPPESGERTSSYKYLAPNGGVLTVANDSLPLLPSEHPKAWGQPMKWGTLIKLYEYRLPHPSAVYFDLAYELSRKLHSVALPFSLLERRDFQSKEYDRTLSGMDVRIAEFRDQIEDGFPLDDEVEIEGLGRLRIKYILFKDAKKERWLSPSEVIFFTVNGQTHAALPRNFYTRLSVKLEFLARDLMTVVDCNGMNRDAQDSLFMAARDHLRDGDDKLAIERALADRLHHHPGLREWNRKRQEQLIQNRLADQETTVDLFEKLVEQDPEIAKLLSLGFEVKAPVKGPKPKEPFKGVKFPTKFELIGKGKDDFTKECPINSYCFVKFETDAENNYFGRADSPGQLTVSPSKVFVNRSLWEGRATVSLKAPPGAKVGDLIPLRIEVTDDSRIQPFSSGLNLKMAAAVAPQPKPPGEKKRHGGRLALPKIFEVKHDEWDSYDFDDLSALEIRKLDEGNDGEANDGKVAVFVNVDNRFLQAQLRQKRMEPSEVKLMTEQFKLAIAVVGIATRNLFREHEDRDAMVDSATKATAQVMLPLIRSLPRFEGIFRDEDE